MCVVRDFNCHQIDCLCSIMDPNSLTDKKCECRLFIGNLDKRVSEVALIKMFSPFGKIVGEDFMWHTRGPKRGEPRGFAFVEFSTKEATELAKEKMHGKLICGRPLTVRLANEKSLMETAEAAPQRVGTSNKSSLTGRSSGQMSRSAKIAAIKNKLKEMEEESNGTKRQKVADKVSCSNGLDRSSTRES
ncbi:hypothetical protein VitviT2T_025130 [Vitis vinifera]|uniref:Probable RNA-binding protein 18 n=1 Tax=Vitis vinifera TaxID=29760 RepID=A0ABY9DJP8_VITVI|nr:hypothetical protein VitviT2T_025130 [Vitis vinifera]